MKNLAYLIALQCVDGLGPVRIKKILEYFEDPKTAWLAGPDEFKKLGLPQKTISGLQKSRRETEPEKFLETITRNGIKIVTVYDGIYPGRLKDIYDPPVVLYYKGELPDIRRAIGVVGTRKVSSYGRLVTEKLTGELTESGFVIVSGLARGVDTVAHATAVKANGLTIAVLGGGLNAIFPGENNKLADSIASGFGAVVSEYPPDYPALAGNFPARNRIIAGLSQGILVTEATEDSGSLITAHLGLEQGKEVFAVPGPITSPGSSGTSALIKQGARLVTCAGDILEEFGLDKFRKYPVKTVSVETVSETERLILGLVSGESKHVDQIVRELRKPAAEISGFLIKLEISGLIKNTGGGNYIKSF